MSSAIGNRGVVSTTGENKNLAKHGQERHHRESGAEKSVDHIKRMAHNQGKSQPSVEEREREREMS